MHGDARVDPLIGVPDFCSSQVYLQLMGEAYKYHSTLAGVYKRQGAHWINNNGTAIWSLREHWVIGSSKDRGGEKGKLYSQPTPCPETAGRGWMYAGPNGWEEADANVISWSEGEAMCAKHSQQSCDKN